MSLHPQATAILQAMAALGGPVIEESNPAEFREYYASRQMPSPVQLHEIRDVVAGGVPSRLYRPSNYTNLGLLVYYHGGGWVIGNLDSHDAVCRSLADRM
jgi:acetyl esterase